MKNDFYFLSKDGKTQIHAIAWVPEGEIRGVLQISHGMCEFIDRYDAFARFLNDQGYVVTGNDHLGHGESIQAEGYHGYFAEPDGNACVIADLHTLHEMTALKYPDVPYYLLGHSMGSFLARQYIIRYGKSLTAAIIMGTGSKPDMVLKIGMTLSNLIGTFRGQMHRSSFINNLAFGAYNKKFEPARTPVDWLSRNPENVDAYLANPWCTFMFTVNAYHGLFASMYEAQQPSNIAKIPKDLPILLVSGQDDPVGDFTAGVQIVYDAYQKAGIQNVDLKYYDQDRHEILNEVDRDQVYTDLLQWMENHR